MTLKINPWVCAFSIYVDSMVRILTLSESIDQDSTGLNSGHDGGCASVTTGENSREHITGGSLQYFL